MNQNHGDRELQARFHELRAEVGESAPPFGVAMRTLQ